MGTISTVSGYYNLYDSTKQYTELLFRAGKILQSKEVNEIQSMLKNQIKNVGDTILTNGDIIEGCQLVLDLSNSKATLTAGKIYMGGDVRTIGDTEIDITGSGTEVIGALLVQEVVTPDEDPSMNDIATGYDNYNQEGAYRLKESVRITVNDVNASILYTLIDGAQLSVSTTEDLTQLDKINATLARRTYDESGNYKVNGLKLVDKNSYSDDHIFITMEFGKAYVRGFEINKPTSTTIGLEKPTTKRIVSNEPKIYHENTDKYVLNNNYVSDIKSLVAIVQATQNVTRGSVIGGIDYLPLSPVVEIVSITQGETTFVQGTDFQLINDGVDWSIGDDAPEPGTTYVATWNYNKTMVKNTDYELEVEGDNGYVVFLDEDLPVDNTSFLVGYEFALCRRDTISLDKLGNIIVTKGQPDILRTVESPSASVEDSLILGSTLMKPNSNEITILNNSTQTIPMIDLYKMLERINSLEYNQAITDLDNEAAEGENATELIGVFTDGFLGLSKADLYHSEWTASIDLDYQELTLPFNTSVSTLVPDKNNNFRAGLFNRLMTAPYEEITMLNQPLATGILRINSYNAFPKTPTLSINPEVDNWIEEDTVLLEGGTRTKSVTLRRWWYHKNASWAQAEKALWQSSGLANGGASLGWNGTTMTKTRSVVNSILDEAILYMRQNNVNVSVENLEPFVDNITATFNDDIVSLTPFELQYQGTQAGTLKADSSGVTKGYFTIPANVLCGTKEVKLFPVNTPSLVGTANYTANGRKITTTKTVFTEKIRLNASDPLAQSFQFDLDQFLTGVGIYFNDKDLSEPITVQVRNMINGYPGTTCYTEKVLLPSEIKLSTNGSEETKVVFPDPVYCRAGEQYCFTVLSNSDIDSVYIAETTKTDITTGTQVSKNPYLNGTLFSSSNALTWTAHQNSDMKFKIYGAKFETTGQCIFQGITGVELDRIMIASEESIPTGCSIRWKYSVNGGDFSPIEIYDDRDMDVLIEDAIVKVEIDANSHTSPAIALDSLVLCGFTNLLSGVYISKNVHVADGYNSIKQVIDLHLPANTNVNMYYSVDTDGLDWQTLENTSVVQKSSEYKTYTFEAELDNSATEYRCKVELTTVNRVSRPKAQNLRSIMKTV